jgi:hypothetical protein
MAQEPRSDLDEVTALKGGAELRIPQAPAKDGADYLFGIFHFKAVSEGALIRDPITENRSDGVLHAVREGTWFIGSWQTHEIDPPAPALRTGLFGWRVAN